jgi:hypothetical protein
MNQAIRWQKSTYSEGGDGNACLELATTPTDWQKSTYSDGGDGNTCVELATTGPRLIHLRESETPTAHLTTAPTALALLLHGIRSGAVQRTPRGVTPPR